MGRPAKSTRYAVEYHYRTLHGRLCWALYAQRRTLREAVGVTDALTHKRIVTVRIRRVVETRTTIWRCRMRRAPRADKD